MSEEEAGPKAEEPQVQAWSTEPPELSIFEVIRLELAWPNSHESEHASMWQDADELDEQQKEEQMGKTRA